MGNFSEIDSFLDRFALYRKSLNPNQEHVHSFKQIESSLENLGLSDFQMSLVADQAFQIVQSVVYHFPENIFWDFDYLIFRISNHSVSSDSFENSIKDYSTRILRIFELFGAHSPIKFRYIHDLIYGYDWLKWMLEKRKQNESSDPFDVPFLEYIHARGLELISLIQKNDTDYPQLEGIYRNPFLFIRSTEEEVLLHKDLSRCGQIPVEAWRFDAVPKSDKNYSQIRLERSKSMGIGKNTIPGSHKI